MTTSKLKLSIDSRPDKFLPKVYLANFSNSKTWLYEGTLINTIDLLYYFGAQSILILVI